jgi:hypothetical protein
VTTSRKEAHGMKAPPGARWAYCCHASGRFPAFFVDCLRSLSSDFSTCTHYHAAFIVQPLIQEKAHEE